MRRFTGYHSYGPAVSRVFQTCLQKVKTEECSHLILTVCLASWKLEYYKVGRYHNLQNGSYVHTKLLLYFLLHRMAGNLTMFVLCLLWLCNLGGPSYFQLLHLFLPLSTFLLRFLPHCQPARPYSSWVKCYNLHMEINPPGWALNNAQPVRYFTD